MKSLHLTTYLLCLLLCCFSCEEPVELDLEVFESQVVVSSNFSPDQPFQIRLSKNKDILTNSPVEFISDAAVQILDEQGGVLRSLSFQKDIIAPYYGLANFRPEPNVNYQLSIDVPGFSTILAQDKVPKPVALKSIQVDSIAFTGTDENSYAINVQTSFTDPSKELNYYHLKLYYKAVAGRTNQNGFTANMQTQLLPITPFVSTEDNPSVIFDIDKSGVLFTDESFNGQGITLAFDALLDRTIAGEFPKIVGELRTVSNSYYQYHTSLSRQLANQDRPFSEPITVFSNIENGLGIFAGFSVYRDSITVIR